MNIYAVAVLFALSILPVRAFADCANPAAQRGDVIFNSDHNVFQGCVTGGWQPLGGFVGPQGPPGGDASADNLGNHTASQNLDLNNFKIIGLSDPTAAQEAATKAYVDAKDKVYFSAYHTSSQSIANSSDVALRPHQYLDIGGDNYNPTNGRFTAPVTGLYQLNAHTNAGWVPTADVAWIRIILNNDPILCGSASTHSTTASMFIDLSCSMAVYMQAGDYVQARMWQSSGASRPFWASFSGFLVHSSP